MSVLARVSLGFRDRVKVRVKVYLHISGISG